MKKFILILNLLLFNMPVYSGYGHGNNIINLPSPLPILFLKRNNREAIFMAMSSRALGSINKVVNGLPLTSRFTKHEIKKLFSTKKDKGIYGNVVEKNGAYNEDTVIRLKDKIDNNDNFKFSWY